MRRRGQQTSLQERLSIQTLAEAGHPDPLIATMLELAPATVRKWRRRGQRDGSVALAPPQGRPPTGTLGTCSQAQRAAIRQLRLDHPGWGPLTLRAELAQHPAWAETPLPSRASIAAFLRQEGLTRPYQKVRALPQPRDTAPDSPHDRWQLDAQGATSVAGLGRVVLINVADVVSRLKVESCPVLGTTQPTTADYQLALRRAFSTYGLPTQLSFDHGGIFYDPTSPSPFPTRLHLWLLALGIEVVFTRLGRPTDHAIIERLHQTMTEQALVGQSWSETAQLWGGLDVRRQQLNTAIPCRALGGVAPLQARPTAAHSGRAYRPEWESALLELGRVDAYLAQGEWFRTSTSHGEFWLGGYRYNLGRRWRQREVHLRYQASTRTLIAQPAGTVETQQFPIKGLTVAELMGEAAEILRLPAYQLALPWTPAAWRQLELVSTLG